MCVCRVRVFRFFSSPSRSLRVINNSRLRLCSSIICNPVTHILRLAQFIPACVFLFSYFSSGKEENYRILIGSMTFSFVHAVFQRFSNGLFAIFLSCVRLCACASFLFVEIRKKNK